MRENRTSGSEGGEAQTNELSLPLSLGTSRVGEVNLIGPRRVLLHWERHGVGEVCGTPIPQRCGEALEGKPDTDKTT